MSPRTLFSDHNEAVLAAIRDGATIGEAATGAGVAEPTVKGWLKRGRQDPKSKYGKFAELVDAAFSDRKMPAAGDLPADRGELLVLASRAARSGNVQAMRLLAEMLEPGDDQGDELSGFDK